MCVTDVRVASAAMAPDHAILITEFFEQLMGVVSVGFFVGEVWDLRVGGAVHWSPLLRIENVAIATNCRIGGPFVTGKCNIPTRIIQLRRDGVQFFPEFLGHLEIVSLVGADIHERSVAGKLEVCAGVIGAECFIGLAVKIAPVVDGGIVRQVARSERVRVAQLQSTVITNDNTGVTFASEAEAFDDCGKFARPECNC